MKRRLTLLPVVLLLAVAAPLHAQELERALDRFANAWAHGDAAAVAALAARSGLSIDVDGGPVGPLGARQAAAMLRRLFDEHETVLLRAGLAQVVGGAPPRAFGELAWLTRTRGTTIPERSTVFLALVHENDGWRITQIRLLR